VLGTRLLHFVLSRSSRVERDYSLKLPRRSERANAVDELENEIKQRMADADMRFIFD
jgi:hypothetical protein